MGSQILCLGSEYAHLSVRALLWLSLAACRSLSRRFFSDSSFSASLGSRRWRGLTYCSSFSSSSFSLMRMRRSRSGSSNPGHASLSSLAICTSMVAILRQGRGGRGEGGHRKELKLSTVLSKSWGTSQHHSWFVGHHGDFSHYNCSNQT